MRTEQPALSVVVTMYDEEEVMPMFFERMRPFLNGLGTSYELVVVDDGSRDRTAALLLEAARDWPQLRIVRLLRNSGHDRRRSAGSAGGDRGVPCGGAGAGCRCGVRRSVGPVERHLGEADDRADVLPVDVPARGRGDPVRRR